MLDIVNQVTELKTTSDKFFSVAETMAPDYIRAAQTYRSSIDISGTDYQLFTSVLDTVQLAQRELARIGFFADSKTSKYAATLIGDVKTYMMRGDSNYLTNTWDIARLILHNAAADYDKGLIEPTDFLWSLWPKKEAQHDAEDDAGADKTAVSKPQAVRQFSVEQLTEICENSNKLAPLNEANIKALRDFAVQCADKEDAATLLKLAITLHTQLQSNTDNHEISVYSGLLADLMRQPKRLVEGLKQDAVKEYAKDILVLDAFRHAPALQELRQQILKSSVLQNILSKCDAKQILAFILDDELTIDVLADVLTDAKFANALIRDEESRQKLFQSARFCQLLQTKAGPVFAREIVQLDIGVTTEQDAVINALSQANHGDRLSAATYQQALSLDTPATNLNSAVKSAFGEESLGANVIILQLKMLTKLAISSADKDNLTDGDVALHQKIAQVFNEQLKAYAQLIEDEPVAAAQLQQAFIAEMHQFADAVQNSPEQSPLHAIKQPQLFDDGIEIFRNIRQQFLQVLVAQKFPPKDIRGLLLVDENGYYPIDINEPRSLVKSFKEAFNAMRAIDRVHQEVILNPNLEVLTFAQIHDRITELTSRYPGQKYQLSPFEVVRSFFKDAIISPYFNDSVNLDLDTTDSEGYYQPVPGELITTTVFRNCLNAVTALEQLHDAMIVDDKFANLSMKQIKAIKERFEKGPVTYKSAWQTLWSQANYVADIVFTVVDHLNFLDIQNLSMMLNGYKILQRIFELRDRVKTILCEIDIPVFDKLLQLSVNAVNVEVIKSYAKKIPVGTDDVLAVVTELHDVNRSVGSDTKKGPSIKHMTLAELDAARREAEAEAKLAAEQKAKKKAEKDVPAQQDLDDSSSEDDEISVSDDDMTPRGHGEDDDNFSDVDLDASDSSSEVPDESKQLPPKPSSTSFSSQTIRLLRKAFKDRQVERGDDSHIINFFESFLEFAEVSANAAQDIMRREESANYDEAFKDFSSFRKTVGDKLTQAWDAISIYHSLLKKYNQIHSNLAARDRDAIAYYVKYADKAFVQVLVQTAHTIAELHALLCHIEVKLGSKAGLMTSLFKEHFQRSSNMLSDMARICNINLPREYIYPYTDLGYRRLKNQWQNNAYFVKEVQAELSLYHDRLAFAAQLTEADITADTVDAFIESNIDVLDLLESEKAQLRQAFKLAANYDKQQHMAVQFISSLFGFGDVLSFSHAKQLLQNKIQSVIERVEGQLAHHQRQADDYRKAMETRYSKAKKPLTLEKDFKPGYERQSKYISYNSIVSALQKLRVSSLTTVLANADGDDVKHRLVNNEALQKLLVKYPVKETAEKAKTAEEQAANNLAYALAKADSQEVQACLAGQRDDDFLPSITAFKRYMKLIDRVEGLVHHLWAPNETATHVLFENPLPELPQFIWDAVKDNVPVDKLPNYIKKLAKGTFPEMGQGTVQYAVEGPLVLINGRETYVAGRSIYEEVTSLLSSEDMMFLAQTLRGLNIPASELIQLEHIFTKFGVKDFKNVIGYVEPKPPIEAPIPVNKPEKKAASKEQKTKDDDIDQALRNCMVQVDESFVAGIQHSNRYLLMSLIAAHRAAIDAGAQPGATTGKLESMAAYIRKVAIYNKIDIGVSYPYTDLLTDTFSKHIEKRLVECDAGIKAAQDQLDALPQDDNSETKDQLTTEITKLKAKKAHYQAKAPGFIEYFNNNKQEEVDHFKEEAVAAKNTIRRELNIIRHMLGELDQIEKKLQPKYLFNITPDRKLESIRQIRDRLKTEKNSLNARFARQLTKNEAHMFANRKSSHSLDMVKDWWGSRCDVQTGYNNNWAIRSAQYVLEFIYKFIETLFWYLAIRSVHSSDMTNQQVMADRYLPRFFSSKADDPVHQVEAMLENTQHLSI